MKQLPPVSVVIPTRNSAATLLSLLNSITAQSYNQVETVIVDNFSRDVTVDVARRFTNKIYLRGPERSVQRNYGAEFAEGEILIFLDSDMVLTKFVIEEVVQAFSTNSKLQAIILPEESFGLGFWAKCKRLERSFYVGIGWMEAARAFRRSAFFSVGGYDENNTGTEDYDLPHRVEEVFGPSSIGRVDAFVGHNEGEVSLLRLCRKKFYYSRELDVYISRSVNRSYFIKQADPLRRFALLVSRPQWLLSNPIVALGMIFMKLCEMAAGAVGFLVRKVSKSGHHNLYS